MGRIFAQPLAVSNLGSISGCSGNCSLVLIADDLDNVWAYDATSDALVWSLNLATKANGYSISCSNLPLNMDFGPCDAPNYAGNTIGVIGTPVIDSTAKILYVAAPVWDGVSTISYYLFAINITNPGGGNGVSWTTIGGSVTGNDPGKNSKCSDGSNNGSVNFDIDHIQRSALLLLSSSGTTTVYIAFAPAGSEWENGWLFGYNFDSTHFQFTQTAKFVTTPNGTGGGIWGSGSGPASDGTDIYLTTGNGTFDFNTQTQMAGPDYGDSILRLGTTPVNGVLPIKDFFTPSDVYGYNEPVPPQGLCPNDVDLGSGGILIFPDKFYNSMNLMVSADKQSNLYFENLAHLGGFISPVADNVEVYLTPNGENNQVYPQRDQGYWSSPAYWKYVDSQQQTQYLLYYSVSTDGGNPLDYREQPYPIYQYSLTTSVNSQGPITDSVNESANPTSTLFCIHSPTPSGSSSQNMAGILWAIESQNTDSPNDCGGQKKSIILHAYDAVSMSQLYASPAQFAHFELGVQTAFPVPTIFNGRVYVGTSTEVDVFGMCNEGIGGACSPQ